MSERKQRMREMSAGEVIIRAALAVMFGIYSIQDIKKRSISLFVLLGIVPCFIIGFLFQKGSWIWSSVGGAVLGGLFYLFSLCSGGRFGRGDAIVIGIAGIGLGFWKCLLLVFYGLLLAAGFSIGVIFCYGYQKKWKIPLIPFLTAGYLFVLWL